MQNFIIEPSKQIEIREKYDVVVVGGGIAGVAAAVAAARNGAQTCLLEKEYALGGLATLGLVTAYLPLCDGMGNIVSSGLAEELLLLSVRDGSAKVPKCWRTGGSVEERKKQRYFLEYNAASYMLELENFVKAAGVKLFYDCRLVGVHMQNNSVAAVITESKSGREAIACHAAVDAGGDADLCFLAGENTVSLNTNSASGWYYTNGSEGVRLHKLYKPFDPCGRTLPPGTQRGYRGDSLNEVNAHIAESRQMIREHLKKICEEKPDSVFFPFMIPTFPGFRMTRRLKGQLCIDAEDRREYPDSIGLIANWRKPGPVYSIPLRALRGKCRNLFAAGRCISAQKNGWDMTRVIPACSVTGEAAGTAASMCRHGLDWNYQDLQNFLMKQQVKINFSQIGD
ncbi:MAG: FAD-dependent oxidoreductase [Victivallaceae bacterium]